MAIFTYCNQYRNYAERNGTVVQQGTLVNSALYTQIDNVSDIEQMQLQGASHEDLYRGYVFAWNIDLQRQDVLIDSSTNVVYRLKGNPEAFPDGHYEVLLSHPRSS